jgi:hypothetical protein
MFKVYKLEGFSGIIVILLLLAILIVLAIISLPILIGVIFLILVYLGYRKFKKSIKEFMRNLKKKKIKIDNESQNGDVEIHFAKSVSIESGKEEKQKQQNEYIEKNQKEKLTVAITDDSNNDSNNGVNINKSEKLTMKLDDLETKQFVTYLIEKGLKFENDLLYYDDKLVYPIYKKSYPINEIIRLYTDKPKTDIIILGLKGEPYKPKFTYIIPVEESRERMSIDELKDYLANI